MSGVIDVPALLRGLTLNDKRGYLWLASETSIPLEVLLGEVKYAVRPLTIPHAMAYAAAFGVSLGELVDGRVFHAVRAAESLFESLVVADGQSPQAERIGASRAVAQRAVGDSWHVPQSAERAA